MEIFIRKKVTWKNTYISSSELLMAVFESTRIVVDQYLNKENMKRKENFLYAGIKKLIKYCLILGKKIGEKNFKISLNYF